MPGISSNLEQKIQTSASRFLSAQRTMLVLLIWLALFLDTLECFCPVKPYVVLNEHLSANSRLFSSSAETSDTTHTTITLPSSAPGDNEKSVLHDIHVRSLLSDDQVGTALKLAVDYAESNGRFDNPDSDRHPAYATCDFPVDDCEELESFLESTEFQRRLFDQFAELYNVDADDLSFMDLFVAYYQAKTDTGSEDIDLDQVNIMDRLELHRDGSLFSFSLLLNPPEEFQGGGTFYDALRDVDPSDCDEGILHSGGAIRPARAGDAVLHCGKILHGADVVTSGRRIVLVGFVDVSGRCIRKGILGNSCKEWGRQDVASYRYRRQEKKKHKGWVLNNSRWLSGSSNNSVVRGFVPASSGVIRRADPEDCRRRRLEAEDNLLQKILLPPEERGPKDFEGFQGLSFDAVDDGSISFLPEVVGE